MNVKIIERKPISINKQKNKEDDRGGGGSSPKQTMVQKTKCIVTESEIL